MNECYCSRWQVKDGDTTRALTACGPHPTKRLYAQGHDAKLKSALIALGRLDNPPQVGIGDGQFHPLAEAIQRHLQPKLGTQIAAALNRRPKPASQPVKVKVGRWVYDGLQHPDGQVTYHDKRGNAQTVDSSKIVS